MSSTYVNNLRLNEMATGDGSGTWGTTTNTNLELIGQALGYGTRAIADASTDNITIADGASDSDRAMYLKLTGGGQACTVSLLPNTASKVWIMENVTSYTLAFTCGSGANVSILAGETKIIATDGAGSGGVVYDVLTDVNLAGVTKVDDLTVGDDLTVTDDLAVGGDIDLEGAIDVNGTSNLDIVDIDGAVDMASTLTVGGVVDITDATDSSDATGDTGALRTEGGASIAKKLYVGTDLDVDGTSNLDIVDIDGAVDMATTLALAGNADFNGDLDVDGTTNLDVVDIDGAVDMASTLAIAGVATAAVSANITEGALADGTTAWDAAAKANATLVLEENTTISAPSNPVAGAIISIEVAQHATSGPYTLAWNTVFEFAASTTPTMTATDAKTDVYAFRYNGSVWQEIGRSQNMAQT